MKKISVLFLILFAAGTVRAQKNQYLFSNFINNGQDGLHLAYSNDGLTWNALNNGHALLAPQIGKDKLMRDPCIIYGPDKTFHMVWTTGWWDRSIGYASSKDLIHWSEQKSIPVMEHEPTARNAWAPEIFYDDRQKEYLIFWATTIPGRHSEVLWTESEKDLNHRIYFVKTKDFQTFSETKMFFNPSFNVIDASILKVGSWYYMFLKNENSLPAEKNIRVTRSKNAAGPYPENVSPPITGNYWAEGPSSIKIGKYVYTYFDKYNARTYGAVRSKDMKEWEDVSDKVSFPKGAKHGTVLKVPEGIIRGLISTGNTLD